ncbi:hypothetical protein AAV94_07705 [Lampropedia cohaerens]|uniref:Transcription factor zinc-finger domain-containing protein n=1 Tax=Lampropedia cohaerens TaxID=1610491 RepID=A0A0U1PZY4_9BURK|nr:zf-TFIIB domain-containing protein [Lampropedia cohaerens]KKW68031.1 hypothetical protein AAV94_07705 [Lampropedia cohaerens]
MVATAAPDHAALWPAPLPCPSCTSAMEALRIESHQGKPVELDLCFACQGIWFDHRESLQLSTHGTLALFRKLHAHRDDPHLPLKQQLRCPRCRQALQKGNDRTISGAYTVYRCATHGRFSTFASFMVEKGFVRHLGPAEVRALAEKVRIIHCSSCGAAVDLRRDHACPYCRSAFSLLDPHAVERALARLQQRTPATAAQADFPEAAAQVLIAQERMRQDNARRERERRSEALEISGFADELWSAGLSLLGRLLGR